MNCLSPREQQRLRHDILLLVHEKHWEGCGGFQITDDVRVTIAAQAALMSLGFNATPFDRLLSILVYPDTFVARPSRRQPWGLEEVAAEPRLGEAWYQGPVILAWKQVQQECRDGPDGRNVVIHEFAHLLDMSDREVDGIPSLADRQNAEQWSRVFHQQFERLLRRLHTGRPSVLDAYAGTSPAEFFAVASEVFFCQPVELRSEYPPLYDLLQTYYRQDPANWAAVRCHT